MINHLRWGLLSTARINRALILAIRAASRSSLEAVASRNLDNAKTYAQVNNIPRCFGSYQAMLDDPDIDAVYISLPNHLHAEWSIKALQAGKHVLVEKPVALVSSDVFAIKEAAREAGKIAAEAYMYRHLARTHKVQELVNTGSIGEIRFISGSFTYNLTRESDIRLEQPMGGGSLWDVGCYPVSYARMITGVSPVLVFGDQIDSRQGVDMTFAGQLVYPNGIIAQITSSFTLPYHTFMEIRGTEGTISVPLPFSPRDPTQKISLNHGDKVTTFGFPPVELYLGEVEDIEKAALDGAQPRISLEESGEIISTIQALYQSAKTGKQSS